MRCAACIDQPGSFNPDLAADVPLPELDDKGQKAHGQFMTYVFDLIDGTRDSSQYEDDVRALLGARTLSFPFLLIFKPFFGVSISAILCTCSARRPCAAGCTDSVLFHNRFSDIHTL